MTPAEKLHPDEAERRASPRYPLDEGVGIDFLAEGRRSRAVVQDVSVRGMRLALDEACAVGSPVQLEHPVAGEFQGVCVWRDDKAIGIELVEPKREIERVLQCVCLLVGVTARAAR